MNKKIIVFDTETTGKFDFRAPALANHQPNLVQLAAASYDANGDCRSKFSLIIRPERWVIPDEVAQIHGITQDLAECVGLPLWVVLDTFAQFARSATLFVAHNWDFDSGILATAFHRAGAAAGTSPISRISQPSVSYCTMRNGAVLTKIPGQYGDWKWPKLQELHRHLFGTEFEGAHDALADVEACARCYFAMTRKGVAA